MVEGPIGLKLFKRVSARDAEHKEPAMTWTTPTLIEICLGLEINGYLPAEI